MIEINNLTTNLIDQSYFEKIALAVLKEEGKKDVELSLALVGQGRMRKLNKMYRGKNKVADVLAFPESKVLLGKFKVDPLEKIEGLGEIIICLREVKKNSTRFKTSFKKELGLVLIHGILHLLGYEHEKDEKSAKEMEEKQNYYLNKIIG